MARHASPLQSLLVDDRFDGDVYPNEPMSRHTTYRIGGPARFFVRVNSVGALTGLVDVCATEGVPWVAVGRGSNVLVADGGFAGVVVALGRDFRTTRFEDGRFLAGAGASLSSVVQDAFRRNLGGFEFAVGTPGTIGGALRMNAGSRDEWISSRVVTVTTYRPGRGLMRLRGDDIAWGYRTSSFAPDEVILECELAAEEADPFVVRDKMEANLARRQQSQPLSEPTCGSVFKNPEGASVGRLIDELGLKGTACGGACISPLHGNFIVNRGGATAADVRTLMDHVRARVQEAHGIDLAYEVRLVGFDEGARG
ncbi:UDP-N-acetylmuramate dehydrogenase [Adlercreutzia sp. R7]|uniref:UDP-N-acetylenolpyruvoylglucosamine reductase n=1 Tax=Adlercreutzia wanghongyangiae TaxID=3111451 RepID=A0ABU6IIZ7_9ACTN|nr:UDP-N-acetylmuramate dehydrogenase [Adlercreutzia sp. R7]